MSRLRQQHHRLHLLWAQETISGSAAGQGSVSGNVVRSSVVSGTDNYTDQVQMRLRGRQVNLKVESDTTGVKWRLGAPRLDVDQTVVDE